MRSGTAVNILMQKRVRFTSEQDTIRHLLVGLFLEIVMLVKMKIR